MFCGLFPRHIASFPSLFLFRILLLLLPSDMAPENTSLVTLLISIRPGMLMTHTPNTYITQTLEDGHYRFASCLWSTT